MQTACGSNDHLSHSVGCTSFPHSLLGECGGDYVEGDDVMDWSSWPQWVVIFALVFPVIAWPAARAVGLSKDKNLDDWIAEYLGTCVAKGLAAFVLYAGGFWS